MVTISRHVDDHIGRNIIISTSDFLPALFFKLKTSLMINDKRAMQFHSALYSVRAADSGSRLIMEI